MEVDIATTDGFFRASVPSGASTGIHEAVEMRDGGERWMGKGERAGPAAVAQCLAAAPGSSTPMSES